MTNPVNKKLSEADILEMRRAYAAGEETLGSLGRKFVVSRQHVHRVLAGVKPPGPAARPSPPKAREGANPPQGGAAQGVGSTHPVAPTPPTPLAGQPMPPSGRDAECSTGQPVPHRGSSHLTNRRG